MSVVVDHVFVCTSVGAPEANKLIDFGLTEGSPNQHPGQGTACRRFFFRNAMLELIWVEHPTEVQSEQTRRTHLWDRWSAAGPGVSPFGIILRPGKTPSEECPFPSWEYRPKTMPDLSLQIASNTGLDEPMWCYMPTGRPPSEAPAARRQLLEHPTGFREITAVHLVCPPLPEPSITRDMADGRAITLEFGVTHLLELQFDGALEGKQTDFRPDLPLVIRS